MQVIIDSTAAQTATQNKSNCFQTEMLLPCVYWNQFQALPALPLSLAPGLGRAHTLQGQRRCWICQSDR